MAIKPKSRAHEDRIKALEKYNHEIFEIVRTLAELGRDVSLRVDALERRRWWQFWK